MSLPQLAYGSAATWTITVRNDNGTAVNVSGWTSRADIEKFDDISSWSVALSLSNASVTNGAVAGTLTLAITGAQTASLASYFGSPTPTRLARLSFYSTPSGGSEALVFRAMVEILPSGAAVVPFSQGVESDAFSVNVSALSGTVYSDATSTLHGLHSAGDKARHDRHHTCVKYVRASGLSDDTDILAFEAALTEANQGARIVLIGKHRWTRFVNPTLTQGTSGWALCGEATGRPSEDTNGAIVEYTGPRVAGGTMLAMDSATEFYIEKIRWKPRLAEHVATFGHGPTAADTHRIDVLDCPVDGAENLICTSATSWTPAIETKSFVVPGGLTSSFPIGTRVLVASRSSLTSGKGAQGWGTVASYLGTSLTITFDETFNEKGGASSDWNIHTPVVAAFKWEAATWGHTDGCTFTNCYHAAVLNGNVLSVGMRTSCAVGFGYQFIADSGAGAICLDHVSCEAGYYKGGQLLHAKAGVRVEAAGYSADACAFRPWMLFEGCLKVMVPYCELETTSTDPLEAPICIRGVEFPDILSGRVTTGSGGYAVNFTGGATSTYPYVGLSVSTGTNLIYGTLGVHFNNRPMGRQLDGTFETGAGVRGRYFFTQYGMTCAFTNLDINAAAGLKLAPSGVNAHQVGGGTPSIHSIAYNDGSTYLWWVATTTAVTIKHESAAETTPSKRIITSTGADIAVAAPAAGAFKLLGFLYSNVLNRYLYIPFAT